MKMSNHCRARSEGQLIPRPSVWLPSALAVLLSSSLFITTLANAAEESTPLPTPSSKTGVTFDNDIKPLFERSCTKCHGEEKQKAKLRLDSLENVLAGAKGEGVLIPGKSAQSKLVLVTAKATDDDTEWMPPPDKAPELTQEEIGLLRAWIDQGAK